MSFDRKNLLSRFLPAILWMAQIFVFSAHSNPADFLPRFLIKFLWNTFIFGQRLFFLLGPVGHLFNFGVLSFLFARALAWKDPLRDRYLLFAFICSFLYGVTDEVHQLFVPQRAFQLLDIFVDGLGALFGLGFFMLYRLKRWQSIQEEALLL